METLLVIRLLLIQQMLLNYKSYIALFCLVIILSIITICVYRQPCNKHSVKETYIDNSRILKYPEYHMLDPTNTKDGVPARLSIPDFETKYITLGQNPSYKTTLNSFGDTKFVDSYFVGDVVIGEYADYSFNYDRMKTDLTEYGKMYTTIMNIVYPVGSIYLTTNDIDPNEQFKGTKWERIKNKYLLNHANQSKYNYIKTKEPGSEGGTTKITLKNVTRHYHSLPERETELSGAHNHGLLTYTDFDSKHVMDIDETPYPDCNIKAYEGGTLNVGNPTDYNYRCKGTGVDINHIDNAYDRQQYYTIFFDEKHVLFKGNQERVKTFYTLSQKSDVTHKHELAYYNNEKDLKGLTLTGTPEMTGTVGENVDWYPPSICIYGWKRIA